ncbi:RNA polymerase sigma factor [Arsenicitalea aurantiaca]|uniref:RNA polymerase sigma factor n=1 Tax=Arsenicitalea aurantiaca TaxID=1783274 RepID=UPI001FCE5B74|nr:RNA polymerase sigma factor [Arsenicitalea aurantiaca]
MSAEFERRFAPVSDRLYRYAFGLTRDRETASDLFHDAVLRAIGARDLPEADPAFRAWLFRIVRNLWIDGQRADRRRAGFDRELAEGEPAPARPGEHPVETGLVVREAFAMLSIEHQEVLALVDIGGFGYEETAQLLSIPKGTVMSRVSRARQCMFDLLAGDRVIPFPAQKSRNAR